MGSCGLLSVSGMEMLGERIAEGECDRLGVISGGLPPTWILHLQINEDAETG